MTKLQALKHFTKRRSDYARKLRYTGNISHIKNYIDVNMKGQDCIVEIFIRPLNQVEREIYGKPQPLFEVLQKRKSERPRSTRAVASSRKRLEKQPTKVPGADGSSGRLDKVQA